MTPFANSLIKASAGTGKTYALVTRMIRLLLLGEEPNHIVALTFSRAAAGEIFNRLAARLAAAAESDEQAAAESERIFEDLGPEPEQALASRWGRPLARAAFAGLLRKLIATQHASLIGTIDSFMTRMVQAFPLELGLQGALKIMDDYRIGREKSAAMTSLLNRVASTPEADLFFEAFRQATFGKESKSYDEKLQTFVETWHETLLDYPDARAWGRPEVIWPRGEPFRILGEPARLAQRLADEIRDDWAQVGREKAWDDFCAFVRDFNATFPAKAGVQNVLAAYRPEEASIEIAYNRKSICFTGEKARLIRTAVETLYALTLRARCESTQGLFRLMAQIEAAYAQSTRIRGLLTFNDIPRLIGALDASVRQNIEYRFDGRFRHWALDEFQDTSRAQWAAVSNLIDEVIQSPDGERSVFIVGDMKQAIYGWRGGDVAIFEREADSGHYALAELNTSHRYCPQIADLVNRVFDGGRIAAQLAAGAPKAGRTWQRLWAPHVSNERTGHVRVERVPAPDRSSDEKAIDPYLKMACEQLLHTRPWERGLSAAVLVRSNDQGKRFAEALRRADIPAVWEGESAICDTPAVTALLHVLQAAEHPGDTLAWRHVCATPLAGTVFRDACALPAARGAAALSRRVLDDVSRLGLPRALRAYIETAFGTGGDPFTQTRLDALLRAAAQFQAAADPEATLTDFAAFVEAFVTRDVADTSTVKVLTIHRSKGLGFDFVLLPIIEATGLESTRPDEALFGEDGAWLLTQPGKLLVEADPVLSAASDCNRNDGVFEALCVFYVAMTRAKRALTVLLRPKSEKSDSAAGKFFSDHVEAALGGALPWTAGDPRWFESERAAAPTPLPQTAAAPSAQAKRDAIRRTTPSSRAVFGRSAGDLFGPRDGQALQRGTRLHAALSRIEWLDPASALPADLPAKEINLADPSPFRDALTRPPDVIDLWRERDFETIANGEWLSGTFDRVVFTETPAGRRAEICDFKSNRRHADETADAFGRRMAATYAGQMASYRGALRQLTGLSEASIRCTLLLTDTLQAVTV